VEKQRIPYTDSASRIIVDLDTTLKKSKVVRQLYKVLKTDGCHLISVNGFVGITAKYARNDVKI